MSSVVRLSLHPDDDAKVTPFEVLRDFADVQTGWSYLEEDSKHYSDLKDAPGLVLRHRSNATTYVDLGFVASSSTPDLVMLAVLDRPNADTSLSPDDRSAVLDTFLDAIRGYLSERPDHVTLRVERDAADPSSA
jgi:hypothetical protein